MQVARKSTHMFLESLTNPGPVMANQTNWGLRAPPTAHEDTPIKITGAPDYWKCLPAFGLSPHLLNTPLMAA